MTKKKPEKHIGDDEKSLFRNAMKDVRRLKSTSTVEHPRTPPKIRHDRSEVDQDLSFAISEHLPQIASEDSLFYQRGSIQANQIRKLKRGQITIAAELDLHGFTQAQAAKELAEFLSVCVEQGLRYVRVIHGKGYRSNENTGVLKSAVNQWLQQSSNVLAFCSAPTKDGGTGAVNILLRREKV